MDLSSEFRYHGYLAPEGAIEQLARELPVDAIRLDRLFLVPGPLQPCFWTQNIWYDAEIITYDSIADAARKLRERQAFWHLYPWQQVRRARLIEEKLPRFSNKPRHFPTVLPQTPLGSWTLLDRQHLLLAERCASLFPDGEIVFEQNHHDPPSRAYLKLWEAFTLAGQSPQPHERCLELGAAPGGWTWVLASLGTNVLAVDRAPLAPSVAAMPGVTFRQGNAFAMRPESSESFDWIFSDVICYPEKLYEFVQSWLQLQPCPNFVCTLKFQGSTHYDIVQAFSAIPHSRVLHLFHNKHELTWICIPPR